MAGTLQDFKAELFRALANPIRVRILETLRAAGSLTVSDIQQRIGIESSNVSQHLSILRAHGLVTAERQGTRAMYTVADPELYSLLDVARSIFEKHLTEQALMLERSE